MKSWKVIKFDPFTHEVTSRHLSSGEVFSVVVPPAHRTPERSANFLAEAHKNYAFKSKKDIPEETANKSNTYLYLALTALVIDLCLRAYGI